MFQASNFFAVRSPSYAKSELWLSLPIAPMFVSETQDSDSFVWLFAWNLRRSLYTYLHPLSGTDDVSGELWQLLTPIHGEGDKLCEWHSQVYGFTHSCFLCFGLARTNNTCIQSVTVEFSLQSHISFWRGDCTCKHGHSSEESYNVVGYSSVGQVSGIVDQDLIKM
jgi:hypothetical protein